MSDADAKPGVRIKERHRSAKARTVVSWTSGKDGALVPQLLCVGLRLP